MLIRYQRFAKKRFESRWVSGNDVQEAYKRMISLVVVDVNKYRLVDERPISRAANRFAWYQHFSWQPNLRELHELVGRSRQIEVNSRNYDVKYLSDGLYIAGLPTEYNRLSIPRKKAPCCIIMLDNYSDVAGNLDDANASSPKWKI